MSDSKISSLVAQVSQELDLEIPELDKVSIMKEVKHLVESKLRVPELLDSGDESSELFGEKPTGESEKDIVLKSVNSAQITETGQDSITESGVSNVEGSSISVVNPQSTIVLVKDMATKLTSATVKKRCTIKKKESCVGKIPTLNTCGDRKRKRESGIQKKQSGSGISKSMQDGLGGCSKAFAVGEIDGHKTDECLEDSDISNTTDNLLKQKFEAQSGLTITPVKVKLKDCLDSGQQVGMVQGMQQSINKGLDKQNFIDRSKIIIVNDNRTGRKRTYNAEKMTGGVGVKRRKQMVCEVSEKNKGERPGKEYKNASIKKQSGYTCRTVMKTSKNASNWMNMGVNFTDVLKLKSIYERSCSRTLKNSRLLWKRKQFTFKRKKRTKLKTCVENKANKKVDHAEVIVQDSSNSQLFYKQMNFCRMPLNKFAGDILNPETLLYDNRDFKERFKCDSVNDSTQFNPEIVEIERDEESEEHYIDPKTGCIVFDQKDNHESSLNPVTGEIEYTCRENEKDDLRGDLEENQENTFQAKYENFDNNDMVMEDSKFNKDLPLETLNTNSVKDGKTGSMNAQWNWKEMETDVLFIKEEFVDNNDIVNWKIKNEKSIVAEATEIDVTSQEVGNFNTEKSDFNKTKQVFGDEENDNSTKICSVKSKNKSTLEQSKQDHLMETLKTKKEKIYRDIKENVEKAMKSAGKLKRCEKTGDVFEYGTGELHARDYNRMKRRILYNMDKSMKKVLADVDELQKFLHGTDISISAIKQGIHLVCEKVMKNLRDILFSKKKANSRPYSLGVTNKLRESNKEMVEECIEIISEEEENVEQQRIDSKKAEMEKKRKKDEKYFLLTEKEMQRLRKINQLEQQISRNPVESEVESSNKLNITDYNTGVDEPKGNVKAQGGSSRTQGGYVAVQRGNSNIQRGNSRNQGGYSNTQRGNNKFPRGYSNAQRGNNKFPRGYSNAQRGNNKFPRGYSNAQRGNNKFQSVFNKTQSGYSNTQSGYSKDQNVLTDYSTGMKEAGGDNVVQNFLRRARQEAKLKKERECSMDKNTIYNRNTQTIQHVSDTTRGANDKDSTYELPANFHIKTEPGLSKNVTKYTSLNVKLPSQQNLHPYTEPQLFPSPRSHNVAHLNAESETKQGDVQIPSDQLVGILARQLRLQIEAVNKLAENLPKNSDGSIRAEMHGILNLPFPNMLPANPSKPCGPKTDNVAHMENEQLSVVTPQGTLVIPRQALLPAHSQTSLPQQLFIQPIMPQFESAQSYEILPFPVVYSSPMVGEKQSLLNGQSPPQSVGQTQFLSAQSSTVSKPELIKGPPTLVKLEQIVPAASDNVSTSTTQSQGTQNNSFIQASDTTIASSNLLDSDAAASSTGPTCLNVGSAPLKPLTMEPKIVNCFSLQGVKDEKGDSDANGGKKFVSDASISVCERKTKLDEVLETLKLEKDQKAALKKTLMKHIEKETSNVLQAIDESDVAKIKTGTVDEDNYRVSDELDKSKHAETNKLDNESIGSCSSDITIKNNELQNKERCFDKVVQDSPSLGPTQISRVESLPNATFAEKALINPALNDASSFLLNSQTKSTLPADTLNTVFLEALNNVDVRLTSKAETLIMSHLDSLKLSNPDHESHGKPMTEVNSVVQKRATIHDKTASFTQETSMQPEHENTTVKRIDSPEIFYDEFFKKNWKCRLCGRLFTRRYSYERHEKVHLQLLAECQIYACPICKKSFLEKSDFMKHYRVHIIKALGHSYQYTKTPLTEAAKDKVLVPTVNTAFGCGACGRGCVSQKHLESHLRSHKGDQAYKCHKCHCMFNKESMRQRHLELHKIGEDNSPYQCPVCSNYFWFRNAFQTHFKTHHGNLDSGVVSCFEETSNDATAIEDEVPTTEQDEDDQVSDEDKSLDDEIDVDVEDTATLVSAIAAMEQNRKEILSLKKMLELELMNRVDKSKHQKAPVKYPVMKNMLVGKTGKRIATSANDEKFVSMSIVLDTVIDKAFKSGVKAKTSEKESKFEDENTAFIIEGNELINDFTIEVNVESDSGASDNFETHDDAVDVVRDDIESKDKTCSRYGEKTTLSNDKLTPGMKESLQKYLDRKKLISESETKKGNEHSVVSSYIKCTDDLSATELKGNLLSKPSNRVFKDEVEDTEHCKLGDGSRYEIITDPDYLNQVPTFDEIINSMRKNNMRSRQMGKEKEQRMSTLSHWQHNESLQLSYSAVHVLNNPSQYRELTDVSVQLFRILE